MTISTRLTELLRVEHPIMPSAAVCGDAATCAIFSIGAAGTPAASSRVSHSAIGRVLRNEFSERWRGREAELMQHQAEEAARYDKARESGDFDTAAVIAGEGVDMAGR